MRIINVKRAISVLLMIGIIAVVAGCARWPEPEPEPPGTEYQLEITVEVAGEINPDNGIYYIGLDTDGQTGTGPGKDVDDWEGVFYYIKLDFVGCHLHSDDGESEKDLDFSYDESNKLEITVNLSDLGNPESSIDINVVTTDSKGNTTYDYLNDYFNILTTIYATDLEDDEAEGEGFSSNFDIVKVEALITTLH